MSLALITGASGGIGADLAREHAHRGGDVVLVARSKSKLHALAKELEGLGVKAHVLVQDLSLPGAADKVRAWTQKKGLAVDVLVNNAGFGGHGRFHERGIETDLSMVRLNVEALIALTHAYLPDMVAAGTGRILNVGSTAGFLPGPLQATYYATKAFVNSFSQAIAEELRGTGVSVTVLCPGPVATGFAEAGDLQGVTLFDGAASATDVAKYGYKAMERGKPVAIHGAQYKATMAALRFLPRKAIVKASRMTMEKH